MKYESLKGKTVVVTGATGGLGQALVRAFAENECLVYAAARDVSKLLPVLGEANKGNGAMRALPLRLDVTDPEGFDSVASMAADSGLDIWVNNAGGTLMESVLDIEPKQLEHMAAVNYFGLAYGTQAAAQYMKPNGTGDIVQVLSTSAFTPREHEAAYCGAKAAAAMYTRVAQMELKQFGIRVIPVYPGGMNTSFFDKVGRDVPEQAMDPADVADTILHAVSLPRNVLMDVTPNRFSPPVKK